MTDEERMRVLGERVREYAALRRARHRALADGAAVALLTVLAAMLGSDLGEALMAGTAALSLGVLAFVVRRSHDLEALAAASRWREAAMEGRGLSLRDWRAGVPLAPWDERPAGSASGPA